MLLTLYILAGLFLLLLIGWLGRLFVATWCNARTLSEHDSAEVRRMVDGAQG